MKNWDQNISFAPTMCDPPPPQWPHIMVGLGRAGDITKPAQTRCLRRSAKVAAGTGGGHKPTGTSPYPYSKPSPSTLHQGQLAHFMPRPKRHLGLHPTWNYISIGLSRGPFSRWSRLQHPRGKYHQDRCPIKCVQWTPRTGMIAPQPSGPATQG